MCCKWVSFPRWQTDGVLGPTTVTLTGTAPLQTWCPLQHYITSEEQLGRHLFSVTFKGMYLSFWVQQIAHKKKKQRRAQEMGDDIWGGLDSTAIDEPLPAAAALEFIKSNALLILTLLDLIWLPSALKIVPFQTRKTGLAQLFPHSSNYFAVMNVQH